MSKWEMEKREEIIQALGKSKQWLERNGNIEYTQRPLHTHAYISGYILLIKVGIVLVQ